MSSSLSRRQLLVAGSAAVAGVGFTEAVARGDGTEFVPSWKIERGSWIYQSYLLLPTEQDLGNPPGSTILTRKWAKGTLKLEDGAAPCEAKGTVVLDKDIELQVSVTGRPGNGIIPATFEAVAEGTTGSFAGARYLLNGFAIRGNNGLLSRVYGSVILVSGPHDSPALEPRGMPVPTTGTFTITYAP